MPFNLAALNSATKYPSIPTYHALDERGRIQLGAARLVARGSSVDVVVTMGSWRWEFTVWGETVPTYRAREREG